MRLSVIFLSLALALESLAVPTVVEARDISQAVYNDLVYYFQYASSAYSDSCPKPNGNVLVTVVNETSTDTQGYIARDDSRREIIVVFRGSTSRTDFNTDSQIKPIDLQSTGVSPPAGSTAHTGWLTAYNSVASLVISTVRAQLNAHPGYAIVTSGHSLGGSLSSLAAVSLKSNFPSSKVRMYTYGQPRTYNPAAALWANSLIGTENMFRAVHTTDGAPLSIPQGMNYRHHGTEYWQFADPSTPANVKQCTANGEDSTCSSSVTNPGDAAHLTYFGIDAGTLFCA